MRRTRTASNAVEFAVEFDNGRFINRSGFCDLMAAAFRSEVSILFIP